MRISLWSEKKFTSRQAFLQLTKKEAEDLINFLSRQLNNTEPPKTFVFKSAYEDFMVKTVNPVKTKGLISYAIVDCEEED